MNSVVQISVATDFERNDMVVTVRIPRRDLMCADLDKFDRLLLKECESQDAKVSDKILGLETLVRRIEEHHRGMRNPLAYVQKDLDLLLEGIVKEPEADTDNGEEV